MSATAGAISRQQVARSAAWSAIENGSLALVSFVMLLMLSRWLTPADFGIFSAVLAIIEVLAVLSGMLFHDTLVQRRDVEPESFDTAYTLSGIVGLALMAACWMGAPLFAMRMGEPRAAWLLVVASVGLPIAALATVLVAQQRRQLAFRSLALRSTVSRIAGALVGISVIVLGHGVWGLAAQHLVMAIVGWLMVWVAVDYKPRLRISWARARSLLVEGLPNVSALFLGFVSTRMFIVWSATVLGPEQAGYLSLAVRLIGMLWGMAATAIGQVGLPMMSRLVASGSAMESRFRDVSESCSLVLFSVFAALAAAAPMLVTVLFGVRWAPAAPAVSALALLVALHLPNLLALTLLKSHGRMRDCLLIALVELGTLLVLAAWAFEFAFWPLEGMSGKHLNGALCVWVGREIAVTAFSAWLLRSRLGLELRQQLLAYAWPLAFGGVVVVGAQRWLQAGPMAESSPIAGAAMTIFAALVVYWTLASLFRWQIVRSISLLVHSLWKTEAEPGLAR